MTDEQKIAMLRVMIDSELSEEYDEDEYATETVVLELYLQLAGAKILNRMYPYKTDYEGLTVPDRYAMTQLNIACYMLNKRGAEGQIQHIENGIHRNYGAADIPDAMLQDVVPYCQAIR